MCTCWKLKIEPGSNCILIHLFVLFSNQMLIKWSSLIILCMLSHVMTAFRCSIMYRIVYSIKFSCNFNVFIWMFNARAVYIFENVCIIGISYKTDFVECVFFFFFFFLRYNLLEMFIGVRLSINGLKYMFKYSNTSECEHEHKIRNPLPMTAKLQSSQWHGNQWNLLLSGFSICQANLQTLLCFHDGVYILF